MFRISKILCPTDFSAYSQAALPIAYSLARSYGASLLFLHVRPTPVPIAGGEFGAIPPEPPESDETLRSRMRQSVPESFTGSVECLVEDGDADEEILRTANDRHCDIIVLGTHGRTGLNRLLVGSVAEAVLRKASCPVITVKPKVSQPSAVRTGTETAEGEPNLNASDLVTVCSVANPMEAEIIRTALQGERIPVFVEGLQQAGLVGTLGVPIRIQVRVDDFNRANKFIQTHEAHRP